MMIGVVDVGSNSIRTMTAAAARGTISYSDKCVYTTRLAEGLLASGMLSDARMEQSLAVIRAFCDEMHRADAPVFAYATSAVRDAANRDAFTRRVTEATGTPVDVLSGEQEARFAFQAACGDNSGGMIDIGGGSTQLVTASHAESFPIGCVRAKDLCAACSDSLADIRNTLLPALERQYALAPFSGVSGWVGVGGTITTLSVLHAGVTAYDKRAVNKAPLSRDGLAALLDRLDNMGDQQRAAMPILKNRHDVILHGGTMLAFLMERLHIETLHVSDADGMEGYAAHILSEWAKA